MLGNLSVVQIGFPISYTNNQETNAETKITNQSENEPACVLLEGPDQSAKHMYY